MALLGRLAARLSRRRRPQEGAFEDFRWREVESGPLGGLSLFLPSGDSWGTAVVANLYEPEMLSRVASHAAQGGALYDIGAHFGLYTAAWRNAGGAVVEAFEPVASNRARLNEVLARNDLASGVRLWDVAVSAHSGCGTLKLHPKDASRARLSAPKDGETVRTVALDELMETEGLSPPKVLKIDVEGAELEVLRGAQALISEYEPVVLVEIHGLELGLGVADFMARRGFRLKVLAMKGQFGNLSLCEWARP